MSCDVCHHVSCIMHPGSPSQAAYATYAEADEQRWNWLLTSQPFWWRTVKSGCNRWWTGYEHVRCLNIWFGDMPVASPLRGFLINSVHISTMSPQAYGTTDTPGKCTDKWPTGFTYKASYCSRETRWNLCMSCCGTLGLQPAGWWQLRDGEWNSPLLEVPLACSH